MRPPGARPIGVVVPVRDGGALLGETLASALAHPEVGRVVVVDDGSTDGTLAVARAFAGVETIRLEPARGIGAARNVGIARLDTPLVGLLDADDLWPDFGAAGDPRLPPLDADPRLEVVTGRLRMFRIEPDGGTVWSEPRRQLQVGCSIYRRTVFERVGPFDEDLSGCEDFDWFVRAAERGARISTVEDVTLLYRRHPGNMTALRSTREHLVALPVRAALLRRRAARHGGGP